MLGPNPVSRPEQQAAFRTVRCAGLAWQAIHQRMPLASRVARIPVTPAEAVIERSVPFRVTGRLRKAMDAMLYEGLARRDAAAKAKMSEHSLYLALRKPHVLAYFNAGLEVLRTSERSRNIHRLIAIRDAANNMPAVNAIKVLEQLADAEADGAAGARQAVPGFVINVVNVLPGADRLIEHQEALEPNPLIEHKVVRDE